MIRLGIKDGPLHGEAMQDKRHLLRLGANAFHQDHKYLRAAGSFLHQLGR
jgi:hypothetical protein